MSTPGVWIASGASTPSGTISFGSARTVAAAMAISGLKFRAVSE